MIYFLLATGHPAVLRSRYQEALDWFPQTVPLGNSVVESRISDDGRWFALSLCAADAITSRRLRMGPDRVIAVNGPAVCLNGKPFDDSTIDQLYRLSDSRETTSLLRDMSGSFSIGAVNPRDGLVGFASFDNTYPVYHAQGDGFCAVSNRTSPLARLVGLEPDLRGLAWLVATGNLFGRCTAFEGVSKVAAGEAVHAPVGQTGLTDRTILDIWPNPDAPQRKDLRSREWDELAARLVGNMRATCEAVSERSNLAVTGGKDSRLVLALASAAGVLDRLRAFTRGVPSAGDSIVAREVCRRIGADHELREPQTPVGHGKTKPWSDIRKHVWRYEGIVSPWDSPGTRAVKGRTVTLEGIGGALYRGSHAHKFKKTRPVTVPSMQEAFVNYHQRFDGAGLLRPQVSEDVKGWLFDWVRDTSRHVRLDVLPEKFYADYRLGHWNGPLFQGVPAKMRISPLLDSVCAGEYLRLSSEIRTAEKFHYEIMRRAARSLLSVPFYRDHWNEGVISPVHRFRRSVSTRLGRAPQLWMEEPAPPRRWQWDFAKTQRRAVADLMGRAERVGLGEILDLGRATRWALSEEPLRDVVTVKTLLSLAAVCLFLLEEGVPAYDNIE